MHNMHTMQYKTHNAHYTIQNTLCTHYAQYAHYLLLEVEVQAALLQHGEVLDEQAAVLDALALPQLGAQLELRGLLMRAVFFSAF